MPIIRKISGKLFMLQLSIHFEEIHQELQYSFLNSTVKTVFRETTKNGKETVDDRKIFGALSSDNFIKTLDDFLIANLSIYRLPSKLQSFLKITFGTGTKLVKKLCLKISENIHFVGSHKGSFRSFYGPY